SPWHPADGRASTVRAGWCRGARPAVRRSVRPLPGMRRRCLLTAPIHFLPVRSLGLAGRVVIPNSPDREPSTSCGDDVYALSVVNFPRFITGRIGPNLQKGFGAEADRQIGGFRSDRQAFDPFSTQQLVALGFSVDCLRQAELLAVIGFGECKPSGAYDPPRAGDSDLQPVCERKQPIVFPPLDFLEFMPDQSAGGPALDSRNLGLSVAHFRGSMGATARLWTSSAPSTMPMMRERAQA